MLPVEQQHRDKEQEINGQFHTRTTQKTRYKPVYVCTCPADQEQMNKYRNDTEKERNNDEGAEPVLCQKGVEQDKTNNYKKTGNNYHLRNIFFSSLFHDPIISF
jgi:hypothetical protein